MPLSLGFDGAMDVAVDVVGADQVGYPVRLEHGAHPRLDPGDAEIDTVRFEESVDLRQLRRALRVDEVDALEVEHECPRAAADEAPDPVLERLGSGEEQPAVDAQHRDALVGLIVGILLDVAEYLGVGLAAEERHCGLGGDVDEPPERQQDADHDACKNAGREHPEDRRNGDPEVETGHPVQAP